MSDGEICSVMDSEHIAKWFPATDKCLSVAQVLINLQEQLDNQKAEIDTLIARVNALTYNTVNIDSICSHKYTLYDMINKQRTCTTCGEAFNDDQLGVCSNESLAYSAGEWSVNVEYTTSQPLHLT